MYHIKGVLEETMRINCSIKPENRLTLSQLITAVNQQRARLGLEDVRQSDVVNEIIARAGEQSTINLCGVFVGAAAANDSLVK
ncbi:hypothetical protein ACFH4J_003459 [Escherichia coli]